MTPPHPSPSRTLEERALAQKYAHAIICNPYLKPIVSAQTAQDQVTEQLVALTADLAALHPAQEEGTEHRPPGEVPWPNPTATEEERIAWETRESDRFYEQTAFPTGVKDRQPAVNPPAADWAKAAATEILQVVRQACDNIDVEFVSGRSHEKMVELLLRHAPASLATATDWRKNDPETADYELRKAIGDIVYGSASGKIDAIVELFKPAAATATGDKERIDWLESTEGFDGDKDHPFFRKIRRVGALLDDGADSLRAAIDSARAHRDGGEGETT